MSHGKLNVKYNGFGKVRYLIVKKQSKKYIVLWNKFATKSYLKLLD